MNSRKLIRVLALAAAGGAGCSSPSSSGGTAGTTGTAGTGTTGSAGRAAGGTTGTAGRAGGGTTGTAGTTGTGGGTCAPLTSTVGISTVNGAAVGAALQANSALKKTLPITDLSNNSMFTITGAWLVDMTNRSALGDNAFAFGFVGVTYHGSVPICNVQLNNFVYRDAAGNSQNANVAVSVDMNIAYVVGGTGMQCAGLKQGIPYCLAPGESGIAFNEIGFSGATLANTPITKVDFASITGGATVADAQPDINVAVTGYTVTTIDANSPQTLNVTLKNTGTASVQLGALLPYFLLDEQGLPIYFASITGTQASGTLTTGQSITVSDTNVGFDGSSTRVIFFPRFNRLLQ
jgi:hypothetical protein